MRDTGGSLIASPSRRTPAALTVAIEALVSCHGGFCWDGRGDNPYASILALADHVIVTADSVNMIGEAPRHRAHSAYI